MSFLSHLFEPSFWLEQPWLVAIGVFQIWMLVDAIRRGEWIWALFIFFGWGIAPFWYYFSVYRPSTTTRGFELPGAGTRARIRELQAQIHHLDKPHHHLQLGDVYFRRGNLKKAEACYRATLEREPSDLDARGHLGQALLRMKRPQEAKPLLQSVCLENVKHDYGHSLMAYAETLAALNEKEAAIETWKMVLQNNSYARARVQLAELYVEKGQSEPARMELKEVIADDLHAPRFQRRREKVWTRKAKSLLRKIGK
jgi:tetratricopeptide (TPR) repeat protein